MGHTYSNNLYHIIFSTKNRTGLLSDKISDELHRYIIGIIQNQDCSLLKINSVTDHIHLLCKIKPSLSVSDFVNKVKSNSSRWVKGRFELPYKFQWQSGFSSFSVSESAAGQVIRYIENQQEHHRTVSFEEELKTFLDKHGVDYDPMRYLD
ncbi:MAG: IS200/IS605 family transposase [Planctomycetota bacterium]|nr:MAG: IS200/IS605 family transposase [Planctomycetota bacterium]